ncbi:MAG: DUF2339 domain-containing protein, partial [Candidatus Melainabacteria bacterium]|nr:DUF2339 domain-containing protein [Candidatus Melainabacteria bacterium]
MTFASPSPDQPLNSLESKKERDSAPGDDKLGAEGKGKTDGFEMWLGSHLNKIGVIFLVCGLALLIVNQFQYFTPILKILTGLISGGALIAFGLWFEKKSNLPMYGYVLSAGGWALSYFTAYAAYHLDAVRVIQNPVIALIAMMAISWGAVLHFLRLRSELITTISLSLAFLTTCFSTVSLFTLVSCAVLVVSLVYIVSKMRWYGLFIAGVVASYGIYLYLLLPNAISDPWIQSLGYTAAQARFWLTIGFSSLFWGAFTAALLTLEESSSGKKTILISASLLNFLAYTTAVLSAMDPVYPEKRFAFVLSLGLAYFMSASRGMKSVLPSITTLHTVFALFLVSLAVPLHFTSYWISSMWFLEVPLLAWVGVKNRLPAYSRFAVALATVSFFRLIGHDIWQAAPFAPFGIEEGKLLGTIATCSYLAAFACHRLLQQANGMCSRGYFLLASIAASCTTLYYGYYGYSGNYDWLPLAFIAGGGIAAYTGFQIRDLFARRIGELGIFFATVALIFSHNALIPSVIAACTLFVIDRMYKPFETRQVSIVRVSLNVGALFCLGILSETLWGTYAIGTAWAVLAASLLCLGFQLKDRVYRRAALIIGFVAGLWFNYAAPWATDHALLGLAWRDLTVLVLCSSSAIAAWLYYQPANRNFVGAIWKPAFITCVSFGYLVLQKLLSVEVPHQYLSMAYGATAAIPLLVGTVTAQPALRTVGWTTAGAFSLLALGASISQWHIHSTILLSLIFYAYGFLFKHIKREEKSPTERDLEHVFSFVATLIMAALVGQHGGRCISLLWTLQGLTVLVIGFVSKDKCFRVYGLTLLSLVCAKLIFVDMATLQIAYRIMSFITVGVVLLLTSFFYVRFPGRTGGRSNKTTA